jgi:hypothetical protein
LSPARANPRAAPSPKSEIKNHRYRRHSDIKHCMLFSFCPSQTLKLAGRPIGYVSISKNGIKKNLGVLYEIKKKKQED